MINISVMAKPISKKLVTDLKPFKNPSDLCKPHLFSSIGLEVISLWMEWFLLKISWNMCHFQTKSNSRIKIAKSVLLVGLTRWIFYWSKGSVWKYFIKNFIQLGQLEVWFLKFLCSCVFCLKSGTCVLRSGTSSL